MSAANETSFAVVRGAVLLGIQLRVDRDRGQIMAKLPTGMIDAPTWLRSAKHRDQDGLMFAVDAIEKLLTSDGRTLRHVHEAGPQ